MYEVVENVLMHYGALTGVKVAALLKRFSTRQKKSGRTGVLSRRAFTLIELLMVIAIISLLVSILLPTLSKAREQAKRAVCMSQVKGLLTAILVYSSEYDECIPYWTPPASNPTYNVALAWTIAAPNHIYLYNGSGGWGKLYPDYVDDGHAFYCPSSQVEYEKAIPTSPEECAGLVTIESSYHLRGALTPVYNGGYDYYSLQRDVVRIPVEHHDWIIISDLGYHQYQYTSPTINHPDDNGYPYYYTNGWADGHVSSYFVKNKDWIGFPDYCGVDDDGRAIYPLSRNGFWTAAGMDRMQKDNW